MSSFNSSTAAKMSGQGYKSKILLVTATFVSSDLLTFFMAILSCILPICTSAIIVTMLFPSVVFISFLTTLAKSVMIPQSVPQHNHCLKNDGTEDPGTAPAGPDVDVSEMPTFDQMLCTTIDSHFFVRYLIYF